MPVINQGKAFTQEGVRVCPPSAGATFSMALNGRARGTRDAISLLVAPRPLLPEEAEANQAPLMLVGPDRCSIYVRSSPTATTGQRFNFGTHGTAVLPPNEPAQSWLAPRLGELAEEVCAGGAAALMIVGGAASGKRSVLLGAEGMPHRSSAPRPAEDPRQVCY